MVIATDMVIALDYKSNINVFQRNKPTDFIVKLAKPLVMDHGRRIGVVNAFARSNSECMVGVMCDLCEESLYFGENRPSVGDLFLKKRSTLQQVNVVNPCYYKAREGTNTFIRISLVHDNPKLIIRDFKITLHLTRKKNNE